MIDIKRLAETIGTSNAAKITGSNPSNVHRVANNGDIISTNGYYFLTKIQMRGKSIASTEKCLKIIIACNSVKGLSNKINSIIQFIR